MTMVSIIVPAYNAEKCIDDCLKALQAQEELEERPEIIVVDDGSTDDTPTIVRKYEGVVIIEQENKGPGAARNAGVRAAKGRFLLFTDSDCIPAPNWAAEMVKGFDEGENIALVIGYTTTHHGVDSILAKTQRGRDLVADKPGPITRFNSNNFALRREIAPKFPFDESLRIYGEDYDLGWRILEAGHKAYFWPEARMDHRHALTTEAFFRNGYLEGLGAARLHYKHDKWIPRDLAPIILALLSLVFVPLSRLFALVAVFFFSLFLAALMFNELHFKKKPLLTSIITFPLQFAWYLIKAWGYLLMMARILSRLEPELIAAKRRFRNDVNRGTT